ncbi:MAG TPA: Csp1 family four helix bundle copper storage protein [Polyangiaceae bacterium]|nr:Csp1 family four helix bundle copper storage protein [Polyangiaceae bacterium]
MERRQIVQVATATAIAHSLVTILGCRAAPTGAAAPTPGAAAPPSPSTPELAQLAATTADCVRAGEACLEHCIRSLAAGSSMMAECAKSVQQMIPICRALSSLSAMGSTHARALAGACADVCAECAAVCEPHVGHHAECKACFEACRSSEAAARAVARGGSAP